MLLLFKSQWRKPMLWMWPKASGKLYEILIQSLLSSFSPFCSSMSCKSLWTITEHLHSPINSMTIEYRFFSSCTARTVGIFGCINTCIIWASLRASSSLLHVLPDSCLSTTSIRSLKFFQQAFAIAAFSKAHRFLLWYQVNAADFVCRKVFRSYYLSWLLFLQKKLDI